MDLRDPLLDDADPTKESVYFVQSKGYGVHSANSHRGAFEVAGRLAHFVNTWRVLTKDNWVLQAVRGFKFFLLGNQCRRESQECLPFHQSS